MVPTTVAAAPQMVLAMTEAKGAEMRRAAPGPVGGPVRPERVKAKWESQQAVDARLERVGAELRGRTQQHGGRPQQQPRRHVLVAHLCRRGRKILPAVDSLSAIFSKVANKATRSVAVQRKITLRR